MPSNNFLINSDKEIKVKRRIDLQREKIIIFILHISLCKCGPVHI